MKAWELVRVKIRTSFKWEAKNVLADLVEIKDSRSFRFTLIPDSSYSVYGKVGKFREVEVE